MIIHDVIFTDWCKMLALSISNACELGHGDIWKAREAIYCDTTKRYSPEQLNKFVELGNMLIDIYEKEGPYDAANMSETGSIVRWIDYYRDIVLALCHEHKGCKLHIKYKKPRGETI